MRGACRCQRRAAGASDLCNSLDHAGDFVLEVGIGDRGFVLGRVEAAQRAGIWDGGGLHIERDVDPDGAGAAVQREVVSLFELVADVEGIEHDCGVLGDRLDDRHDIDFLHTELAHAERLAGDRVEHAVGTLDLAGEEERGGGVKPGAGDAGDGVGAARAGGDERDAEAVDGFGVAFGAHGGGLLVRVADGLDALFLRRATR